jgi:diaminopropionate ammonia-lyase
VRAIASGMTFCCATDGNHGRSVAWGAQLAGRLRDIHPCRRLAGPCEQAMAAFGARMNRIAGNYDDSSRALGEMAAKHGWTVVSDTAWPGYEAIPLTVMQGYTTMIGEALDALRPAADSHLPAGRRWRLAAAVAGYASQRLGDAAPKIVVVEPARAACLFETAEAGPDGNAAAWRADSHGDA